MPSTGHRSAPSVRRRESGTFTIWLSTRLALPAEYGPLCYKAAALRYSRSPKGKAANARYKASAKDRGRADRRCQAPPTSSHHQPLPKPLELGAGRDGNQTGGNATGSRRGSPCIHSTSRCAGFALAPIIEELRANGITAPARSQRLSLPAAFRRRRDINSGRITRYSPC
jgi:hypothetical protein